MINALRKARDEMSRLMDDAVYYIRENRHMNTREEVTDWTQKNGSKKLNSSVVREDKSYGDSNLLKAGLAVAAGLILAALAKGVKDSDYFD